MEDLNLYLKIQEPIKFYDVCIIYQPSFIDILNYGFDKFGELLIPYIITLDNLPEEITDEQKEGLTNFDLLCSSKDLMNHLFLSLDFFCKSNLDIDEKGFIFKSKVNFNEDGIPFIFNGRLNKDNFDEFANIILKICGRERPIKEKKKVFANDRQRDIWEKLQKGRNRDAKKHELKLEDVLNICEFGGDSYIPIEEIKKWTLWRIMNCYSSKIGISTYRDSFSIYLVSGKPEIIEGKHWTELIKLDYKPLMEY